MECLKSSLRFELRTKAMFIQYRIDFLSGPKIDPIQCEQCLENRTGLDRLRVEVFTLYRIDLLHILSDLAKETSPRAQESDSKILFQK